MPNDRRRVQLDFSTKAHQQLHQLRAEAEMPTVAALVRNALRLYEWFLTKKREGYRIQLVKDDKILEIELML
jgi:hypothetical protein